ncbi:hypothetical protein Hdeb2414_s0009g00321451 [Helianthus debilis subsp. tardiflorus]
MWPEQKSHVGDGLVLSPKSMFKKSFQDNKIETKINQVHSLFACHLRIQSLAFGSYATLHL